MKHIKDIVYLLLFLCFLSVQLTAQVTNLTLNGSSTTFTMVQGDTLRWEYDLPVGATADGEIWFDLNGNGAIDTSSDQPLFIFTQTDGDTTDDEDVIPDMDSLLNGHNLFAFRAGVAPGQYVLKFTHSGLGASVAGTVTPLPSPAFTVSGNVTPPPGESAQYILVEAERLDDGEPEFWSALTDQNGNYTINFDAGSGSSQWEIFVEVMFPSYVLLPGDTVLTLSGDITGLDFTFLPSAAQVVGFLKDDNNTPLADEQIHMRRDDDAYDRFGYTDNSGFFQVGFLAGDLTGIQWHIDSHNLQGDVATTRMAAQARNLTVNSGDSLVINLVAYNINDQIQGQVRVDGLSPGMQFRVWASNPDTGYSRTLSDMATGDFSIGVSNKIYNYDLFIDNLPPGYNFQGVQAHAGDVGIILDVTVTSVERRESGIPSAYNLYQNYPNPFNPSTAIFFDIVTAGHVQLAIYDLLGKEIATLVDEEKQAGRYEATWNADGFSSGVYFYRLQIAGPSLRSGQGTSGPSQGSGQRFVETKKLILVK